jgi:hypothetical protein
MTIECELEIRQGEPANYLIVGSVRVRPDVLRPRVTAHRALNKYLSKTGVVDWNMLALEELFVTVGEHSYRLIVETYAETCS